MVFKPKYKSFLDFPGCGKMSSFIREIIIKHNLRKILEIGSGANPTINASSVRDLKLDYTTSDIEKGELDKADEVYKKVVLDLSSEKIDLMEQYDLIFSRMVGEHISDGKVFHQNIYKLLNHDGLSVHCYSTLYSLPFLLNKFLPEGVSDLLLRKYAARDEDKHEKFKAYYSWSRGPSKKMVKRFMNIGYEIVEYKGFFGHDYSSSLRAVSNSNIRKL